MTHQLCEREGQTSTAILRGTIDPETASHVRSCGACSDILLVSGFLRSKSALSAGERAATPDPGLIWRKAQWRATEQAIYVAARPIRWMTVVACVAFACSPGLGLGLPLAEDLASSWSKTLDFNFAALSRISSAASNEPVILLAVSGTALILALSSWLMLREE